jgi:copper chaperone
VLLSSRRLALRSLLTIFTGVKSYNVSLENQTAEIITEDSLSYDTVLEKIKKTGKTVNSGEADGTPRDV